MKSFPTEYEPRQIQVQTIDFILESFFNKKKRYCIVQAPTGTGKSFIAATIANHFASLGIQNKSYILTTQIILQAQYEKQFPEYANISSKNNYPCNIYDGSSCGDMKWAHSFMSVPKCSDCIYQQFLDKFIQGPVSITNTAFFMSNVLYNQQLITKRKLVVIDEAHNLQQEIISHKSIELNFQYLHKEFGFKKQHWINEDQNVFKWILDTFYFWAQAKKEDLKNALENSKSGLSLSHRKIIELGKQHDYLEKIILGLNKAIDSFDPRRWVTENKQEDKTISITPLYAFDYSQDMIFQKGQHVLLMSGTILNKQSYCRNLGIPQDECEFISLNSPFPIQNRKIFFLNSGSMSKKNIDQNINNVIITINKILQLHKGEKGIIHVSSHYMAKMIFDKLSSGRLVIAEDFNNRDEMLNFHFENSQGTVLISPSLMQGIDLKDNLSRFQIIAKVPYPNLGSKYISTKKDMVSDWYFYQTVKTIVQSYGRSIRSQIDYAITYILDSDFERLYKYNTKMFPKYFTEALSYGKL